MERKGGDTDKKRQRGTERYWGVGRLIVMGDMDKTRVGASSSGLLLLSGGKRRENNLNREAVGKWNFGGSWS